MANSNMDEDSELTFTPEEHWADKVCLSMSNRECSCCLCRNNRETLENFFKNQPSGFDDTATLTDQFKRETRFILTGLKRAEDGKPHSPAKVDGGS